MRTCSLLIACEFLVAISDQPALLFFEPESGTTNPADRNRNLLLIGPNETGSSSEPRFGWSSPAAQKRRTRCFQAMPKIHFPVAAVKAKA